MIGLAVALVVGMALGAVLAIAISRRTASAAAGPRPPEAIAPVPERSAAQPVAKDDVTQLLRDAIQRLELGVVVSTADGTIAYRNESASVLRGTHIGVLVDEHIESNLALARAGQRSTRMVDLHGPPRTWLAIQSEPLPNGGAVATIQDVSERMRTEAMRTDFVTNISHELKTPVGALAVLADAIDGEDDLEIVHRVVQRIVDEAHRAVNTIDDLLRLSQIESTRHGDDVVDLCAVVAQAIGRGRVADGGRGIEVMSFEPSVPVLVVGDERQLTSAIGNLVENAVKYSKEGGVVQVRCRRSESWVEVMVADQGIGIPERDLDRIFERFYRVDKARSRDTGGTGLGLSIVRHVASNHGGDVLVSSEEGEGSTFVFRLPSSLLVPTGDATGDGEEHDDEGEREALSNTSDQSERAERSGANE